MSSPQIGTQDLGQTTPSPMEVDVRINSLRTEGSTLATASVTLNGCFAIRGVKIVQSNDGPFVSMPSFHTGSGYRDVCFPCTKAFKAQFDQTVLGAYQQQLDQIAAQQAGQWPEQGPGSFSMGGMAM